MSSFFWKRTFELVGQLVDYDALERATGHQMDVGRKIMGSDNE
jgi:hypothetical protein